MPEMKTLNGYEVVDAKAREAIEAFKGVSEVYVMTKPDSEPTPDSMDGNKVLITDAHTIEYLNRIYARELAVGYMWVVGLRHLLITDTVRASTRVTLKAHNLSVRTATHYTNYFDIEPDGNWYWSGYSKDSYTIPTSTKELTNDAGFTTQNYVDEAIAAAVFGEDVKELYTIKIQDLEAKVAALEAKVGGN